MQSYDEVTSKFNKYLSSGQKKALQKRASALSMQNSVARQNVVTDAYKSLKQQNEYLSAMGLSANLQSAPSSGADEVARRMPEMRQELRKLDAAEQGALTPVGAQMAQETINAQLAAQRSDNGMYRISDGNGGFVKNADGTDMWVSKKDKYAVEHGTSTTGQVNRYSHDRVKGYQLAGAANGGGRSVFEVTNKFTTGQTPSVLQDLRDKLTNAPKQNMTNAVAAAANRNETNSIIKSKLGNTAGNFTNAINKVFGTVLNKTQENAVAQAAGIQNIISSFSNNGIITQQAADALAKSVANGSVNLDDVKQQLFERLSIDFGIKTENSANAAMGNVTGGFVSTTAQQVIDGFMIAAESGKTADYDNVVNMYCDYIKEQSDANLQLFDGMLAEYYKAGMQRPELDAARAAFTSGNTELAYNYLNNFENMTQGEAILQAVNAAAGVPSGDPNFSYFPAGEPVISPEQAEDIRNLVEQGRYDEAIDVFNSDAEAYYVKRSDELWSERHEDIHQFYTMPVDEANLDEFYTKNPLVFELDKLYTLAKSAQTPEAWDMYGVAYKNLYNHKADQDRLEAQYGVDILEKVYGMSEDDSAKVMAAWDRMYNEGDFATYEQALANASFAGGIIGYEALMLRNAQLASIGVRFQDYYKYDGMTDEQIQHMIDVLEPVKTEEHPKPAMTGDPLKDAAALTQWQIEENAPERQGSALKTELENVLRVRRIDERTEDLVRLRALDDTALAEYETGLTDRMSKTLTELDPYATGTQYNADKMSPQRLRVIGSMLTGAEKLEFDDIVDEWLLVGSVKTERGQVAKAKHHEELISGIQSEKDYVQWSTYGKNRLYTKEDFAEKEYTPTGDPLIDAAAQTMNLMAFHESQQYDTVFDVQAALQLSDEEFYEQYTLPNEIGGSGKTQFDVYRYMDAEEKGCFYYKLHESPKAAYEFLEDIKPYCTERQTRENQKVATEAAKSHPFLSHLITYATSVPANYSSLINIAKDVVDGEHDPYSEWNTLSVWNSTVRETHYADVATWLTNHNEEELVGITNFVMGGIDSWIDSLINAQFTGGIMNVASLGMSAKAANFVGEAAGLVGFGANAYTTTLRDLDEKGINIEDSRKVATAAAFFEMFFEKIGLENILNGSKDWAKSGIWTTVKSAIIEASEEGNTTWGNITADSMILGNQSNWADDYNAFRNTGHSVAASGALASLESIKSIGLDAAGGGFSGGLSGVVNTARMKIQQQATGAAINAAGRATAVMDAAQSAVDNGTATPALQKLMHTVAEAYAKSNTIANTDLGKLNYLLAVSDMEQADGAIDKLEDEGALTSKEAAAARDAFEQAYDSVSRLEDSAVYGFNQQQIDEMFSEFSEEKRKLIFKSVNENTKGRAQYHAGMNEQRIKQLAESRVGEDVTGDERKKAVADEVEAIKREQEWQRVERAKKAVGYQSVEVDDNIVNSMPTIATENYDGVEVRLHKYQNTEQMGYMNKLRLDFVRAMSKASGVSVVVHDTLPVNGALESNGVMHISLDAQGVGSAIGHELTHFIRQNVTGDEWQNFVKFIKETADKRDKHGFERLAERNMQKYAKVMENITEAQKTALVEEETICGLCEDVLKDDVRMQEFFEESPTLFGKVCAWLDRVVKHFKEIVGDKSYNARLMQHDIEELRDKWFAAFKVATKNAADKKVQKAAETGYAEELGGAWMYSMKDDEYMQLAEQYVRSKEEAGHYRKLALEMQQKNEEWLHYSEPWLRAERLKNELGEVNYQRTELRMQIDDALEAVHNSDEYKRIYMNFFRAKEQLDADLREAIVKNGVYSEEANAIAEQLKENTKKWQAALEDYVGADERLQELWDKETELQERIRELEQKARNASEEAIDYYDDEMEENDAEYDKYSEAAATIEQSAENIKTALETAAKEAAEERGYKWDIYHGTSALFDEFDSDFEQYGLYGKGVYTTEDQSVADSYTSKEGGKNERTIHGFVKSPTEIDMNAPVTTSVSELIQHGLDASKVLLLTDKIDDRAKEAFDKLPQIVNDYEIFVHDIVSKYLSDEDVKSLMQFAKNYLQEGKLNFEELIDLVDFSTRDVPKEDRQAGAEMDSTGEVDGTHKITEEEARLIDSVLALTSDEDYASIFDIDTFITDNNYLEENDTLINNGLWLDDFLSDVGKCLTNDNVFSVIEQHFMESDLFGYSDYMSKDDASADGKNEAQRKLYNKMRDKGTFIKEMYKAAGYTGITHVGGYSMGGGHLHQVHIAFDAHQIKYADAVTRDSSGNIIPLSQRFDESTPNMNFSLKNDLGDSEQYKLDVEHYNSALKTWTLLQDTLKEAEENGDVGAEVQAKAAITKQLDELSKYVIDAGAERGYKQLVFHGTSAAFDAFSPDYEKFGLFGKGVYTTESEDVANSYQTKEKGNDNRTLKMLARIGNEIDMDAGATVSLRETLQAMVDNVNETIENTLTLDEDKENYRKDSIAADAERLVEPMGEYEDALFTEMPITYDTDVFSRKTHEKVCELFKHMNKAANGVNEVPEEINSYRLYLQAARGLLKPRSSATTQLLRELGWMVELRKMAALGDQGSAIEYEQRKQKYTTEYRSHFSNNSRVWQLSETDIDFWEHILDTGKTFSAMNQKAREAAYAKYKELYGFKEYGYDQQLKLLEYMMDRAAENGGINTNEDVYDIVMQLLMRSDSTGLTKGKYKTYGANKNLNNLSHDSGTILKAAWSRMGYTGITHTGGLRMGNGNEHKVHIFFNAQQDLKYADPITYYKNGKPIKLDKRFDDTKTGSETLKFSLKDSDFERRDNDFLEAFRTGNKVLLHKINTEAEVAAGVWSRDGHTYENDVAFDRNGDPIPPSKRYNLKEKAWLYSLKESRETKKDAPKLFSKTWFAKVKKFQTVLKGDNMQYFSVKGKDFNGGDCTYVGNQYMIAKVKGDYDIAGEFNGTSTLKNARAFDDLFKNASDAQNAGDNFAAEDIPSVKELDAFIKKAKEEGLSASLFRLDSKNRFGEVMRSVFIQPAALKAALEVVGDKECYLFAEDAIHPVYFTSADGSVEALVCPVSAYQGSPNDPRQKLFNELYDGVQPEVTTKYASEFIKSHITDTKLKLEDFPKEEIDTVEKILANEGGDWKATSYIRNVAARITTEKEVAAISDGRWEALQKEVEERLKAEGVRTNLDEWREEIEGLRQKLINGEDIAGIDYTRFSEWPPEIYGKFKNDSELTRENDLLHEASEKVTKEIKAEKAKKAKKETAPVEDENARKMKEFEEQQKREAEKDAARKAIRERAEAEVEGKYKYFFTGDLESDIDNVMLITGKDRERLWKEAENTAESVYGKEIPEGKVENIFSNNLRHANERNVESLEEKANTFNPEDDEDAESLYYVYKELAEVNAKKALLSKLADAIEKVVPISGDIPEAAPVETVETAPVETAPVETAETAPAAIPETETNEQVPVTETSKEDQKKANAKWRKEAMQDFRNEQKKEADAIAAEDAEERAAIQEAEGVTPEDIAAQTAAEKKAAADRKAAEKNVEKLRKEKGKLVTRDGILMTPEQAANYDREKAEAKKKIGEQRRNEAYTRRLENEAFRTQREELAKSGIILMTPEEAAAERDAAQFADEWEERTADTVTEDSDAAEKAWEDYIKATYGGLYKTKEEAYEAMTADLKKQQEEEDKYAAEVRAARFHVNDGTRTAPHITEQIQGMDDTPVLYEAQRITEKTPDENGEVKLIPKVIRDIVKSAKASNFLGLKDYSRVMDKVSGKNREIREALSTILEKPFLEAGYRYTHNLPAVRANYMDSMKELGITGENYEKYSAAMQHYGEGYIVVDGEKVDYTLNDLKKDCPENWQQVKKAAEITRDLYDDYVDRINTMLEGIYPDVIEHAYTDKKRLDALVEEEENKAKAYRERAGVVYEQLEKAKARAAKAKHGTDAWAKANASVAMYERRLENVKLIAAKHEGRAAVRRAQAQQITQALATGDEIRNKRLIRRADYMHHTMKEESQGFVERVKNAWTGTAGEIPPELVGKTDVTKPKTGHAKFMDKRRGIDSKADAVGSMLSYIEQAERKLAYDPFIAHLSYVERLVEEAAQDEYEATGAVNANDFKRFIHEWRNDIAGKSNPIDRAFSDSNILPRNLYETLQALGGRANANAVLFNFGSAAVQASNIVNAATYVTNVKDWLTGAYMFARMEYSDAADAQQLREIYQQSTFMTQRYGMELQGDPRNNDSKLKRFATAMMGALDELAGKWMWFSAYNQYNEKRAADVGHTYTNAIEYADDITRRSVAGRGIGERPFTLTSKFVNTAAPFQLEIANTMQNIGEQFGKKNLKGLTLFALTTYAMNLGFKALFGTKKLPWDVIDMLVSAVTDGFDDDDDEEVGVGTKALRTGRNILQGTGGMFLESIPFNSVVLGQLSQNATGILGDYAPETFGSSSLGYGTLLDTAVSAGKLAAHGLNGNWSNFDVFWTDFLENSDWLKMVLPYGGTQAQRSLKGIDAAVRGYSQKLNSDGELEAQFAVNGFFDALRSATLGKWATAGGRAYLAGETKKLTAEETAELKASDLPAKDFFAALQALKDAKKTTKNAYGETIVTSSANQYAAIRDAKPELQMTMLNRMGEKAAGAALKAVDNGVDLNTWLDYMVDYGTHDPEADEGRNAEIRNRLVADVASGKLTNEQAAYMDAAITGAKTVHDYSSPEWYELSGNESHYNMAKWANSQGIDPTLALTWYNNKSTKTLDEYGNEKSIPQEEILKDLQRNVANGTLTEEQAAILETMLYPDKKNKRDFSSEAAFEISASDSNYAYYKASGLDADMALRWYNFKAEKSPDSAGVMHSRKKEEVEDALAQATDMTVAQKEAAHRMMYPDGSKVPDYRSYTWYKIYKSGDSNYKKALFAVRDGAPVEAALKEIEAYNAAKAAGKTWKAKDTKAFCYSLGLSKGQADALYYAMSGKTKN